MEARDVLARFFQCSGCLVARHVGIVLDWIVHSILSCAVVGVVVLLGTSLTRRFSDRSVAESRRGFENGLHWIGRSSGCSDVWKVYISSEATSRETNNLVIAALQ